MEGPTSRANIAAESVAGKERGDVTMLMRADTGAHNMQVT